MVAINFNAVNYEPSTGGGDIFETGEYAFHIVSSKTQNTKSGNGVMLVLEAACLEEGFTGKRLTIRLNIQNPSQQAVEIALRDLSAISHVVGVLQWQDTGQLHGRPFRIRLEKTPRDDKPDQWQNEIRGYLDMAGNAPVKGQPGGGGGNGAPSGAPQAPQAPQQFAAPAQQPQQQQAPQAPQFAQQPPAQQQPAQQQAPAAPAGTPPFAAPSGQGQPWNPGANGQPQAPAGGATPPWQQ